MPWYGYTLIAMFASAWYSISQKWALNLKIDKMKLLLYGFLGLLLFFAVYTFGIRHEYPQLIHLLSFPENLVLALLVAGFSFFGNIMQLKAIKEAPNPGYVQGIVVTNAILVLVFSAIFLGAPITWQKAIGILIVLVGLYLLIVERKTVQESKASWRLSATLAMLCFGSMFVVVKAMTNAGFTSEQVLTILFFFASIGFIIVNRIQKTGFRLGNLPKIILVPIILSISISFITNLLNFMAIGKVSNPGYSTAVFNSSVVLTLIFSSLVFPKDSGGDFSAKKWIGVIVTIGGVVAIILG